MTRRLTAISCLLLALTGGCSSSQPQETVPTDLTSEAAAQATLNDAPREVSAERSTDEPAGVVPPDFRPLRTQSQVVEFALEYKSRVDRFNAGDLKMLWDHVSEILRPMDATQRAEFVTRVEQRIAADAARLRELQTFFTTGPGRVHWWDNLELRKAVGQFLGIPGEAASIFEDAVAFMRQSGDRNPFDPELEGLDIEPAFVASLKTLLIYAIVVGDDLKNLGESPIAEDLRLVYPVTVSARVPQHMIAELALIDQSSRPAVFLIPNAGFVMGGAFQDGNNRGVDCSAFVSHCAGVSQRMTTWVLEFCWREQVHGVETFRSDELPVRQEFLQQWGLREAQEKFEAVEFTTLDDLQPGDLLIRRWGDGETQSRSGNSTIYLKSIDETSVWGIECNRLYHEPTGDRMDGVGFRIYNLFQPGVDVYVLRRKDETSVSQDDSLPSKST